MENFERILLILTAFVIKACGEKKEGEKITLNDKDLIGSAAVVEEQARALVEREVVEISISAGDQMQFSKNELKVETRTNS